MSSLEIIQPSSIPEAVDLLVAAPLPFDSPTNHRVRTRASLEAAFTHGRRRPDWVWAVRNDSRQTVATLAAMAIGDGFVLDLFGATDPRDLTRLLTAANVVADSLPEAEACLFLPAGTELGQGDAHVWQNMLADAGWTLLVERHHYEFSPAADLAADVPTSLRLETPQGPDDPRLRPLMREVLHGSLDAHDRALVDRVGLEAAADESLAFLLDADPWECIRLATTPGDDSPVGFVSWVLVPDGRGFLNHVGVAHRSRGHGYGRQLVALATRALIGEGATTLVADTDATNAPMVEALRATGWPRTETRIDFTRS